MKTVIVLKERDLDDNDVSIIGVASNRENALKIIDEYYGEDSERSQFIDVRDSNIDFYVTIYVPGDYGGNYRITAEDHSIDEMS